MTGWLLCQRIRRLIKHNLFSVHQIPGQLGLLKHINIIGSLRTTDICQTDASIFTSVSLITLNCSFLMSICNYIMQTPVFYIFHWQSTNNYSKEIKQMHLKFQVTIYIHYCNNISHSDITKHHIFNETGSCLLCLENNNVISGNVMFFTPVTV